VPETYYYRGLRQINIETKPILPKKPALGGQAASYAEEHTYISPVEESRYHLVYSFSRT
jgi:hypothetical protein